MGMLRELDLILTGKEKKQAALLAAFDLLMALLDIGFLAVLMLLVSRYTPGGHPIPLTGIAATLAEIPAPLFLGLFLLKNGIGYTGGAYAHRFFAAVSTRLSAEQLQRYFSGDSTHFTQTDASVFVRRISQQPVEFSTYILANLQTVVAQSLLAACAITAILFYHPSLFLVLLLLLLPPLIWMGWLLRKRLRTVRGEIKKTAERSIQFLQESLGGYVEANVYHKTGFFVRRFISQQQKLNHHLSRLQTLQTLPSRWLETVVVAGFFLLVGLRGRVSGAGTADWLTVGVFLGAAWKILPALVKLMNSSGQIKTYSFIIKDLLPEPHHNTAGAVFRRAKTSPAIRSVSVQQLRFCHAAGKPELKMNFQIQGGSLVALTGRSGSGKTTLLQLMSGFLSPGEGSIRLHYQGEIRGVAPADATGIVYVKQQPFILNDTLRKNITLSDEVDDEEKILRVGRLCGLDALIAGHPSGLGQPVSENGRNISGGQRQRIMLARAIFHDPELLLLDEPFSELDETAEIEMMQLLLTLSRTGITVMIATHNASAAAGCDTILSLDKPVYA